MNATVQRIVELLFEDLEISAEVQAIKDEVMNNCQERYEDLLAQGLSEDEATGAVVESLKGRVTVILTTHYLEEAEALADRIAVMAAGRLKALGSVEELLAQTGCKNLEDAFVALAEGGADQ